MMNRRADSLYVLMAYVAMIGHCTRMLCSAACLSLLLLLLLLYAHPLIRLERVYVHLQSFFSHSPSLTIQWHFN